MKRRHKSLLFEIIGEPRDFLVGLGLFIGTIALCTVVVLWGQP